MHKAGTNYESSAGSRVRVNASRGMGDLSFVDGAY